MARDKFDDLDGPEDDAEAEDDSEAGDEGEDEAGDDADIEFEGDELAEEGLAAGGGDFEEPGEEDEEVVALRPPPKRRTPVRAVPMVEGVPKSKLEKPDYAREVWGRLQEKRKGLAPVRYSLACKLAREGVVDHVKFGIGFVIDQPGPNKAEVLFQDSLRRLVHSR